MVGAFDHLATDDYTNALFSDLLPLLRKQSEDWHAGVKQTVIAAMEQHGFAV